MFHATTITNHYHFHAYLLYCLINIGYGCVITCIGPLIPYFAEDQHHHETYYAYLFVCRAAGVITGSFLCKLWQKWFKFHHILGASFFVFGVGCILFYMLGNDVGRGASIFLVSVCCAQISVFMNLCIFEAFKNDDLNTWLQFNHGAFGVGGLLGPFIVYLVQMKIFLIIAGISFIFFPFFFKLPSPEQNANQDDDHRQPDDERQLSTSSALLICVIFYLVVGQESTFGGWVPTYAVLEKISTKEQATSYGTIYWIGITVFRFIIPFTPGSNSQKLKTLCLFGVFSTIVSLVLIHKVDEVGGVIVSAILYGISMSVLFALTYTLCKEFNMRPKPSQGSDFMLSVALGDGTIVWFVGYLIKTFGPDSLFYSMGIFSLLAWLLTVVVVRKLLRESQDYRDNIYTCDSNSSDSL